MTILAPWLVALGAALLFGLLGWLVSLYKKDVSIVDSMWSQMFVVSAMSYVLATGAVGARATLVLVLLFIWSMRLALYITWRNWGEPEDFRYQKMRDNNSPNFDLKSLYIVFGLQAVLAWIVSMPLLASFSDSSPLGMLDAIGVTLWFIGVFFEAVGDYQLARFRANVENDGKVLNTGLWRFTRHPNYFGDFCVWWGFYLIAVSADGAWTIGSPILMTILLLKVSGVALLEKDISIRRPEYADYISRTSAFFPGPPKTENPGHTRLLS